MYNTQPVGFDQYAALYQSYFVGESLLTVHFNRTMNNSADFVGYCGLYFSDTNDVATKITALNKLATDSASLDAGNALQCWFKDPGVIMKRIDATHETDQGLKLQFKYNRAKFFRGNKDADFEEKACGIWGGASWTKPTETAYVTPWICLHYRNSETYAESYSVHCSISITYHCTFTELKDNVMVDTATYND